MIALTNQPEIDAVQALLERSIPDDHQHCILEQGDVRRVIELISALESGIRHVLERRA